MSPFRQALERHREAFHSYQIRSSVPNALIADDPAFKAANALNDDAIAVQDKAWKDLMSEPPRSAEEFALLAMHLDEVVRAFENDFEPTSTIGEAFGALCYNARFLAGWEAMR